MSDFGQSVEVERLVQLLIDMFDYPMHPTLVLGAAIS
jgi:hypothetical protein